MTDLSFIYFKTPYGVHVHSMTTGTDRLFADCQFLIDRGYEIVGTEGIK